MTIATIRGRKGISPLIPTSARRQPFRDRPLEKGGQLILGAARAEVVAQRRNDDGGNECGEHS
jgi:hypothetical protein